MKKLDLGRGWNFVKQAFWGGVEHLCLDTKSNGNSTKVSQQKKGNLSKVGVKAKPP